MVFSFIPRCLRGISAGEKACKNASKIVLENKSESVVNFQDLKPEYTISQAEVQLSAVRPIRIQRLDVRGKVPFHNHDYYEIGIITRGKARHIADGIDQILTKGDVMIVQPGATHGILEAVNVEVINIYYLVEWFLTDLRNLWDDSNVIPIFFSADLFKNRVSPQALQFPVQSEIFNQNLYEINGLLNELKSDKPSSLYLKLNFLKLLIQLSRAFIEKNKDSLNLSFPEKIWLTIHHIEDCLIEQKKFSQLKISEKCGFTPEYHSTLFKQATGFSCTEYYQRRRIQFACKMLLKPSNCISDIVYSLGFNDASHFANYFKKIMKLSPTQYRKRYHA